MKQRSILIDGAWRPATAVGSFRAVNPATGERLPDEYPISASLRRFSQLECYDNVRQDRLPAVLRDHNPNSKTWRLIDGQWTRGDVTV